MSKWLNLSSASTLLGVHPATLRQWADAGKVPAFRTPGGHRRFLREDLRAFLVQASHSAPETELDSEEALLDAALHETRRELRQSPPLEQAWYQKFDEAGMEKQRALGRALYEKSIRYLTLPKQRSSFIAEGRKLGTSYARVSLHYQITLMETVRAFQFFRQKLLRAITSSEASAQLAEQEELTMRTAFDTFFDEVLFGLIEAYETLLAEDAQRLPEIVDPAAS